jgi:hypothetical protein|tara:strand:+ start:324 stop:1202 length:879 start_codon:yes stop_codon:yes gene_type:complete
MAINPNQLHVAKIYPGNYTNVLRFWHETKTIQYENANGVDTNLTGQPVGGPVGVVFQPGWIAQQAVGYVDLSYQALGTNNQLAYYTKPYGSGQNSAEQPFLNANVIVPSPDFHKDVRADITDGIAVPASAYVYRASLRLSGGDIVSSGVAGADATPELTLVPAVGVGLKDDGTVVSGQFGATITGANSAIANGSTASTNIFDSSSWAALGSETTWKLFTTTDLGGAAASGLAQGSGVYDPRAGVNKLAGDDKALAICEVCWIIPDEPPERQDVALQPDGLTESQVYTSTSPS